MNLQLITLRGAKVDQEVYSLTLPTVGGEIGVFPDHEALVTLAVPGVITVHYKEDASSSDQELFAISGGIIEISHKSVRVLVDEADHGDEIVEAESRAALERALEMRDNAQDQVELEKDHQLMDRHSVRLKVAELRRHKKRR
jgi:F-type H+-transporting ATPase subunit epsilon